ncbi:MAG: DUF4920 domain-containing protein [Methanotrichaceae archaeon]|nr:DUF4920 domain-containing protein [Methanotrichaceae archaeon]
MPKNGLYCIVGIATLLCMAYTAVQAAGINYEKVTIKEIMDGNSSSLGKAVQIEGMIEKECPGRGCWIVVNDSTGSLLVDLKPNNFTMPLDLVGSTANVYGNVTVVGEKKKLTFEPGTPYIIGKKVEISGEFKSPLVVTG